MDVELFKRDDSVGWIADCKGCGQPYGDSVRIGALDEKIERALEESEDDVPGIARSMAGQLPTLLRNAPDNRFSLPLIGISGYGPCCDPS